MSGAEWFNLIQDLLVSTLRMSTPITLAALGAVICERSGIVNIAMEGMMLFSAFFAAAAALATGNPWIGLMAGVISGGIIAMLHAWATISLHLNHVISGAVINILAFGMTRFMMIQIYGHPGTTDMIQKTLGDYRLNIPVLTRIPLIGPLIFNQTPIIYLSVILVFVLIIMMKKTRFGLHLRAAGEHPMALETLGISVIKVRYQAVILCGMLSGLAGAYLSIENSSSFSEGMTSGRGFIALAANISGGWSPMGSFVASLFFGFVDALQMRFQILKVLPIPAEFFIMFPYVATVVAVAGFVRRSRPPKELGNDFIIESRDN
jgi:simple sugar transport system permease protein